jgi:hypothetical protein
MTLLLNLTDWFSAMFLDHPLGTIAVMICANVTIMLLLLWVSLTGYTTVDMMLRREHRKHIMVIGKCHVPAYDEIVSVGTNSETGAEEYKSRIVPDQWRIMVQAGGNKGVCLVTRSQFEVVSLGNRPLARYIIGRFSREVFVREIKI